MKKVEFQVRFDGTTEGLPTHRLSLSAFKTTLPNLIEALQMSAELASRGESASFKAVRVGPVGRSVDWEIESISDGCVTLNGLLTMSAEGASLVPEDFRERTATTFLNSLRAAPGAAGNPSIARYLKSLPAGVISHHYKASVNGSEFASLEIGSRRPATPASTSPRLVTVTATILGAVFRPKHERVTLMLDGGKKLTCRATAGVVERALTLRGDKVTVTTLTTPDAKGSDRVDLVTLRPAAEPLEAPSAAERDAYLFQKWAGALARLAE